MNNFIETKDLRNWAKENLIATTIYHKGLGQEIHFTVSGIKEYLNQPHKHYYEKNRLIKNIVRIIEEALYYGEAPDKHGNTNTYFYYLKTQIENEDSYIVIKHTKHNNQYALYSVVDGLRITNNR
ncbi:hypothetical protein AGMMS4957_20590 [Bacteroidia bacterium]|nr:hypothetical protein AGMMS4957_20590 [Bacteroidia bacterium]